MTDTKNHISGVGAGSLEGQVLGPTSASEIAEAVELAFDYRGDVTLSLPSGESVVGYLFNRQVAGVCGGIAEYFGLDPTMVRVVYVLLSFSPSFQGSWPTSFYGC